MKQLLGLFDNPYTDTSLVSKVVNSKENQQLALDAARKVITLLKNKDNTLPLPKVCAHAMNVCLELTSTGQTLKTLAVIGPSSDICQTGDYSGEGVPDNFITTLEGIRAKVPSTQIMHIWYVHFFLCVLLASLHSVSHQRGCGIQTDNEWQPIRPSYLFPPTSRKSKSGGLAATQGLKGEYFNNLQLVSVSNEAPYTHTIQRRGTLCMSQPTC